LQVCEKIETYERKRDMRPQDKVYYRVYFLDNQNQILLF